MQLRLHYSLYRPSTVEGEHVEEHYTDTFNNDGLKSVGDYRRLAKKLKWLCQRRVYATLLDEGGERCGGVNGSLKHWWFNPAKFSLPLPENGLTLMSRFLLMPPNDYYDYWLSSAGLHGEIFQLMNMLAKEGVPEDAMETVQKDYDWYGQWRLKIRNTEKAKLALLTIHVRQEKAFEKKKRAMIKAQQQERARMRREGKQHQEWDKLYGGCF